MTDKNIEESSKVEKINKLVGELNNAFHELAIERLNVDIKIDDGTAVNGHPRKVISVKPWRRVDIVPTQ